MNRRTIFLTLSAALAVSGLALEASTPDEALDEVSFQEAPPAARQPVSDTAIEVGDLLGTALASHVPAPLPGDAAPAAEPVRQSARQGASYRVQSGDSLSAIARRLLGDPRRWRELVQLNAERYPSLLKNPNLILVGWDLRLPGDAVAGPDSTAAAPTTPRPAPVPPTTGSRTSPEAPTPPTTTAPNPAPETTSMPTAPSRPTPAGPTGTSSTTTSSTAQTSGEPLIGPNSRVLHIGDSHTVGVYGNTIDDLMRRTGAQVSTYGVAGSSPSWWWNGTTTRCGYSSRDANGRLDRPADWRTPRQTPDFQRLIEETRPSVIVISLGANMIGASDSQIRSQCQRMCEMAKASGAKIIWVGPPDGREDKKPTSRQAALYESLRRAVEPYGTFVDSRPYTEYPETGGDGVHYGGTEGTRRARAWAEQAFNEMQRAPR